MRRFVRILLPVLLALAFPWKGMGQGFVSADDVRPASYAGSEPRFRAFLYYSDHVEEAHRAFAHQAIDFFRKLTVGEGFILESYALDSVLSSSFRLNDHPFDFLFRQAHSSELFRH